MQDIWVENGDVSQKSGQVATLPHVLTWYRGHKSQYYVRCSETGGWLARRSWDAFFSQRELDLKENLSNTVGLGSHDQSSGRKGSDPGQSELILALTLLKDA